MTSCIHHNGKGCRLGLYGGRPSEGVCARCDRYSGPLRGAGDVVHVALTVTGVNRLVKRMGGCAGCGERRAKTNWKK